jgi:hypothetical protein
MCGGRSLFLGSVMIQRVQSQIPKMCDLKSVVCTQLLRLQPTSDVWGVRPALLLLVAMMIRSQAQYTRCRWMTGLQLYQCSMLQHDYREAGCAQPGVYLMCKSSMPLSLAQVQMPARNGLINYSA